MDKRSELRDEGVSKKSKVTQNVLKHTLVLEFLKSDEFFEIGNFF